MVCDMQKLVDSYAEWISKQMTICHVGEYYELTTPFLDRHNDSIQIYVKEMNDGRYLLTDGGYTLSNLTDSGIVLDSDGEKRFNVLERILNSLSVSLMNDDELAVYASNITFPQMQHNLIMAILTVNSIGL